MAIATDARLARAPRGALLGVVLVAVVVGVGAAEASIIKALTVEQLRERADVIASGRVVAVRAVSSGGAIETVARIRVERAWRGDAARTLLVRVPGGTADGRRLIVPGVPRFSRGDRVLVFLYRAGREYRPVGLFQGVWQLDAAAPDLARASDAAGAALVAPESGVAAVGVPARSLQELLGTSGGAR